LAAAKRALSASERERRDEERRRLERTEDVVIGKTSALPGERDFELNLKATEEEWFRQASEIEQKVFRYTEDGMKALKTFDLDKASSSFDQVFKLRPSAYLWQAGIVKFYQNELEEAARIFSQSATVFESRYGEPASEERIWRNACQLKLLSSLDKRERRRIGEIGGINLPTIPETEETEEILKSERRKAIKIARDMFDATVAKDHSRTILAKAKLRSVGGVFEENPKLDIKMWKLNAWFYLGLYHDAVGDVEESKKCMKMALRLCPSIGNGNDIIHTLPMMHMVVRDWFDDDPVEEGGDESDGSWNTLQAPKRATPSKNNSSPDPLVTQAIQDGVEKLKLTELKEALKVRGLRGTGSKEELQNRLLKSLMEDTGLIQ
jgi:tetratricopeptide (TPR) repeat protein